jgi:hypothetical protein
MKIHIYQYLNGQALEPGCPGRGELQLEAAQFILEMVVDIVETRMPTRTAGTPSRPVRFSK